MKRNKAVRVEVQQLDPGQLQGILHLRGHVMREVFDLSGDTALPSDLLRPTCGRAGRRR